MLRLKRLQIKDFGIHESGDYAMDGNVIGLTGLNGAGKSTILQAVQYALTGTIDHEDNLADFIRRSGIKQPSNATVELDFAVDGKPGKIVRKITKTSTSRVLTWDGQDYKADKEVSAKMLELMGVDAKAINSTVFIKQGSFMNLFGDDSSRVDFYTKLLMLQHLDKLADVVDSHRKRVAERVSDLGPVKDARESAYAEAREQYDAKVAEMEDFPDRSTEIRHLANIIGSYAALDNAATDEKAAKARRDILNTEDMANAGTLRNTLSLELQGLQKRESDWTSYRSRMATMRTEIAELEADATVRAQLQETDASIAGHEEVAAALRSKVSKERAEGLRAAIKAFDVHAKLIVEIPELNRTLADNRARLAKGKAEAVEIRSQHTAARDAFLALDRDHSMLSKLSELAAEGGCDQTCRMCGHNGPDHEYVRTQLAAIRPQLDPARKAVSALQEKLTSFERGITTLEGTIERDQSRAETLREQLTAATVAAMVASSKEEAITELAAIEDASARLFTAVSAIETLQRTRRSLVASLKHAAADNANARLAELKILVTETAAPPWTADDQARRSAVQVEMNDLAHRLSEYDAAAARHEEAKRSLAMREAELSNVINTAAMAVDKLVGLSLSYGNVQDMHREAVEAQAEHQRRQGAVSASMESLKSADKALQDIVNRIASQQRRIDLVKDLTRIRDAFRPSGALARYLDYKFGMIARLAGDYLAAGQANYTVSPSAVRPLSYEFLRSNVPGAVWMDQNRLSGGQKVRLAVATLRAIHAMVMPDVGLLVLDEPTTHVDYVVKESLAGLLQQISEEGSIQVLVCDHDPTVIGAADVKIMVGEQ